MDTNHPDKYLEIAIILPIHRTFTYLVSGDPASAVVGKRVLVPFGKRTVSGYILTRADASDQTDIKPIIHILDLKPLFPESMVALFRWAADYYIHPIGMVIKNALPGGLNTQDQQSLAITAKGQTALEKTILTPMEKSFLNALEKGPLHLKKIKTEFHGLSNPMTRNMLNRGWIESVRTIRRDQVRPKMERYVTLIPENIPSKKVSKQREALIEALADEKPLPLRSLKSVNSNAAELVRKMARAGYISITEKRVFRDPLGEVVTPSETPELTKEQRDAVRSVGDVIGNGFSTFLLAGVTGSGKTEVYIRLTRLALDKGLSVLVLVPEISLISQMERRYRARFGERVALLHSGLSAGERLDQWQKVMDRDAGIAIGARSAVFAPFERIGLLIVDEEHDTSYKQEGALRYNARDLAIVRARQHGCVALLGSATPSIQSYHNAVTGKYKQIQLTKRVEQRDLPKITVVDLSSSRDNRGLRRFFSNQLLSALKETVEKNEQAIFFLNRRGFANFPVCAACGKPVQCKNCSITLTFHNKDNAYRCHYCGYSRPSVSTCLDCGSDRILQLGLGTEKVESWLKSLYPEKNIVRMDRDTVSRKGAILKILKGLKNREIDILVGTQMVTKGHDFPGITLVGIVCADLSLSFPDFRAGERTFQLLAQVAGRAGRGETPGRVILQTYNPDHFSIQCAQAQDYRAFYQKEIQFRKNLDYPPYSRMIQIKISSRSKEKGWRHADFLNEHARQIIRSNPVFEKEIRIFGPLASPVAKIATFHRWQMLIKGMHIAPLREFVQRLMFDGLPKPGREVKTAVDVDPFFML